MTTWVVYAVEMSSGRSIVASVEQRNSSQEAVEDALRKTDFYGSVRVHCWEVPDDAEFVDVSRKVQW